MSYHSYMLKASVSELKNQLSAYLRKVRAGESVLVFDRRNPVARIEPVERRAEVDEKLARLERNGLVRTSTQPMPLDLLGSPGPRAKRSIVAALVEERRKGR